MPDDRTQLPMTAPEFTAAVKQAIERNGDDAEGSHADTDELMAEVLTSLGYGEGVKLLMAETRWYA